MHTSPDVNFDRIAYLAKIVFNAKIVTVSLIDNDIEYVLSLCCKTGE